MATFEIQAPDGSVYQIDGQTEAGAVSALKKLLEAEAQPKVSNAQAQFDAAPFYAKPFIAANDLARIAGDTLSGGYGDKFAAYMDQRGAPDTGPHDNPMAYENVLSRNRQMTNDAYERAGFAGGIAGFLSMASPVGAVGKGAGLLKTAPGVVRKATKYAGGLLGGAAYGAYSAAGHDQDIGEGAFYGGAFGAGGQLLGHAIGNATQQAGKLLKQWGYGTPEQAAHKIHELARSMGITATAAKQRMAELGPEGMLVDLLGKPGTSMGRAAANVSPEAREIIESAATARKSGQNERIVGTLEDATGLPRGSRITTDDLKQSEYDKVSSQINKAYDAAREAGADIPLDYFKEVLDSPMGEDAFKQAVRSLQNRMAISGDKAGGNLAVIDEMKKILDSKATMARRSGDKATADVASSMARHLRYQMDTSLTGSEYSTARAMRQQQYRREEAIDLGEELAGGRIPADLPQKAAKVAPENKGLLSQSYAIKQSENLLNRNSTEGAMNRLLTPLGTEARDAALGPAAPRLQRALDNERTFNTTHRELSGNSTTTRQLMDVLGGSGVGLLGAYATGQDLATGGVTGALLGAGRRYAPLLAGKLATKKKRLLAPEIAGLLTRRALPNQPIPRGVVPLLGQAIEKLSQAKKDALARGLAVGGIAYGTNRGVP